MRSEILTSKTDQMYREMIQGHTLNLEDERQNAEYIVHHMANHSERIYYMTVIDRVHGRDVLLRQLIFAKVFHRYMCHINHEEFVDLHDQLEDFFKYDHRLEYRIEERFGEWVLRGVYMDVYGQENDYREELHEVHLYTFPLKKEAEWIMHIMQICEERLDYVHNPF